MPWKIPYITILSKVQCIILGAESKDIHGKLSKKNIVYNTDDNKAFKKRLIKVENYHYMR